jgi:hypothetical protein
MDMPLHPPESDDVAFQRGNPRDSIFLGAILWFDGDDAAYNVRVRNISAGGMMIDFPQVCEKGRRVKTDLRNIGKVDGVVAWSTETRMGIRFNNAIDAAKARMKPGTAQAPIPGVPKIYGADRRPGLAIR